MSYLNSNVRGWDLLYRVIEGDIKKKEDVLIAFVHLVLINCDYRCIGLGDSKTLHGDEKPSEALPKGWNADSTSFTLRYVKEGKLFLFKGLVADDDMIIHLLNVQDVAVSSIAFNIGSTVIALKGEDIKDLIPNFCEVINKVRCELIKFTFNKEVTTQTCRSDPPLRPDGPRHSHEVPVRPELLVGRPDRQGRPDPFEYGHSDLDPLGGSRGPGMIFDPFQSTGPPLQPGLGIPGPLPRGAIPPGARFDPMGPPDTNRRPRFNPDPDHMPPPGYEDMFM